MKNFVFPALLWLVALVPALAQSEVRPVAPFHAISVGTGIELDLTAGPAQHVEVSASSTEYRNLIQTTVVDGVLTLRYQTPEQHNNWSVFRSNKHLHVAVTADQLTALKASSGAAVTARGSFAAADNFELTASSGATLTADMATAALTVRQSSGSTVALSGHAASIDVHTSSGATFDGENLQTDRCQVQASSGGSVRIDVRKSLEAKASSGGSVSYSGSPAVTKHTSSGGSVGGR